MPFLDVKHDSGIAYGDGYVQGDAQSGQVMRIVGDDIFSVADDATEPAFGVLYADVKDGDMPTIYTDGGVYETDNFTGTLLAGELLKVHNANGNLTNGVGASDQVVAKAISLSGGVLKFRLLV